MLPKIENMTSPRSGEAVPNQLIIRDGKKTVFQSYQSIIAVVDKNGKVTLDSEKWNFSVTTSKYRNQFLGEDTKTTKRKIQDGIYKLTKLN